MVFQSSASSSGSDSDISSAGEDDDGGISLEAIRSKIVNKHLPTKSAKVMNEVRILKFVNYRCAFL